MATIKRLVLEWGDGAWTVTTNIGSLITQGGTLEQAIVMARDAALELELAWPAEKALEVDDA